MVIWMEVTRDRYEFPVLIADSGAELARLAGTTYGNVLKAAHRKPKKRSRFVRVEVEEDEDVY